MFDNSTILITGGTGSFGNAFVSMTLAKYNPKKIIIYSRDEMKQYEMAKKYPNENRLRFFIGDVRDRERLYRAFHRVDYVVHAAATKIVPSAEYNPFECIKTNVNGAMNVIDAAIDTGVKRVVALSTDKACLPINLYGATKLCSDKLFISGNFYSPGLTRLSVVRYGNVMGSRGSVIPLFMEQSKKGIFTITDERMSRFMITLEQGVELVWTTFEDMQGGEIYVKKIPSMKVMDIAKAVSKTAKIDIIGIRPGEKLHECMISQEDAPFTYELPAYYKILPQTLIEMAMHSMQKDNFKRDGTLVAKDFVYSSECNNEWMDISTLRKWIDENKDKVDAF